MYKLFTALSLILLFNKSYSQIPTNGLVGAWTFNGNANDISGNNNNGTVYGASLTTDRCGNPNSAYSFNGTSDYIQMLSAGPTGSVSRSVSFWAKTTATNLMTTFAYGNSSGGLAYAIQHNYNCPGVGVDVNNQALTRGSSCVVNNSWHHIVAVLNSTTGIQLSNVVFYLDGVQLPSISCVISGSTQTINTGSNFPIAIGRIHDASSRFFDGSLDDFYLYNRALNPAEVQQLFTACSSTIIGSSTVCPGASASFSINPVASGSYSWGLPNGWTGSSTTNSISVIPNSVSGIISVSANLGCGGSLSSSLNVSIPINPTIAIIASNNASVCAGSSLSLSASGANNYTWFPGSISGSSIVITPSTSTIYTVSAAPSCSAVNASASVIVQPNPTILFNNSSPSVCAGNSATLSSTGANTYTWYPGVLQSNSIVVSPTSSVIYTVTGENNAGCKSNATLALNVFQLPLVSIVNTKTLICIGNSVTLSATGASSFTWSPGSYTSSTISVNPLVTTTYSVTGTDGNGCKNQSIQIVNVDECLGSYQFNNLGGNSIKVFPNPTEGRVFIELTSESQVLVIDMLGQILINKKFNKGKYELNLKELPKALYFVKVSFENQTQTIKLIKE